MRGVILMAQVSPETFGQNLWFIIGAILLLGLVLMGALVAWTAVRTIRAVRRQRRALLSYHLEMRRADGRKYPPFVQGRCQRCGRGDERIYVADSGEELCPPCYEAHWRAAEHADTAGDEPPGPPDATG